MMRHIGAAVLAISLLAFSYPPASPVRADASFGFFYSDLAPHGSWLISGSYGRVWQPSVYAPGWNPYYDGHWVYSDVGWMWVSDYPWGSVPYHYGTWVADPALGWVWVPGYVWAPSWVVFRTGPDYIGWAPVAPGYTVGASISVGGGDFIFVSSGNFLAGRIGTVVVPESTTRVVINKTRVVNNITIENDVVVNRGPDVRTIEGASGTKVRQVPVESVPKAGPGPRFSRSEARIASAGTAGPLKVTTPYAASQPLPAGREADPKGGGRGKERGPAAQSGAVAPSVNTPQAAPSGNAPKGPPSRNAPQKGVEKPRGGPPSPTADAPQPPSSRNAPQKGAEKPRGGPPNPTADAPQPPPSDRTQGARGQNDTGEKQKKPARPQKKPKQNQTDEQNTEKGPGARSAEGGNSTGGDQK